MSEFERVLDELVANAPVAQASWDDVQRRAQRSRRRRVVVAAAAVVGIAIIAPTVAVAGQLFGLFGGDGTPVNTQSLSARELHAIGAMANGTSPRVPASTREDESRIDASSLRQIATRNGHAFFVANRQGGGVCVSVGVVGSTRTLGSITCSPDFPSRSMPILDQSVFAGSIDARTVRLLEGFATDGVAGVGLRTAGGVVEAKTPVENNVYYRNTSLPAEPIDEIVALDASGNVIYSSTQEL
jgi:hypothetical protein